MSDERWIVVRNWNEYQHPDVLRTKVPAWIKLSNGILHNEEFLELDFRRRAIFLLLLSEYSMSRGQLTNNTRSLSRRLHGRVLKSDIESFVQAGFITLSASKPASKPASKVASLDKRREETPKSPYGENRKNGRVYNCDICPGGMTFKTQQRLDEHLHVVHP